MMGSPQNTLSWGLAAAFVLLPAICLAQGGQKARQITPSTIRVESVAEEGEGAWIILDGYLETGSPCISPDNQWVAFDARELGYGKSPGEIWIARRDGSKLHKLVNGSTPRWSPDSKRILFAREDAEGVSFVRVIDADGTDEKRICRGTWPDWSPDGSQIAYSDEGKPGGGARLFSRIYIANKDGSDAELIAAGDCPSWSPDGKRIACCYRDPALPAPFIRIVELGTNKQRFAGPGFYRANWTSDSKGLIANGVVAAGRIGPIKMNALEKAAIQPLEVPYEHVLSPHQSLDGTYNVFVAQKPEN